MSDFEALQAEEEDIGPEFKGSTIGKAIIGRHRVVGHVLLYSDYFMTNASSLLINFDVVSRWSSMCSCDLVEGVKNNDDYIKLKRF